MGELPRVKIAPSRILVSRPGVNVNNPPDYSPRYIALDSNWPRIERIFIKAVLSSNLLDKPVILFTPQAEPPFGLLFRKTRGLPDDAIQYDGIAHETDPFGATPHLGYIYDRHVVAHTRKDQAVLAQVIKQSFVSGQGLKQFPDSTKWGFLFLALG